MSLGFQPANILSAGSAPESAGGKVAIKSKGIYKNQKTRLNRAAGDSSESDEAPRRGIKLQRESDDCGDDDSDDDVALFKNNNKPAGVSVLHENPERPTYGNRDKEDYDSDDSAQAALF